MPLSWVTHYSEYQASGLKEFCCNNIRLTSTQDCLTHQVLVPLSWLLFSFTLENAINSIQWNPTSKWIALWCPHLLSTVVAKNVGWTECLRDNIHPTPMFLIDIRIFYVLCVCVCVCVDFCFLEVFFGSMSSPLCVWELERVCSQTQLCQLRCLMTILDNYMFWPLLAIFRLSLRKLKVLLYNVPPRNTTPRKKRNTPLHTNFNLDTSHQTPSCRACHHIEHSS